MNNPLLLQGKKQKGIGFTIIFDGETYAFDPISDVYYFPETIEEIIGVCSGVMSKYLEDIERSNSGELLQCAKEKKA